MALSRLTKGLVGGFFTRNARIAFGYGCDRPSYVRPEGSADHASRKAEIEWATVGMN